MHRTVARAALIGILLVSGAAAGYRVWVLDRRAAEAAAAHGDAVLHLARLGDAVAGIGTAQQAYVAPGQLDEPWFERTSDLAAELRRELIASTVRLHSPAAAAGLATLEAAADDLEAADARTRQNLRIGQDLMAADVIFSDGRSLIDAMLATVRDLGAAEESHHRAALEDTARQRTAILAALGLLWVAAAFALARAPRRESAAVVTATVPAAETPAGPAPAPPPPQPTLDLGAAATLCTELSRVTSTAVLPGLLARAAPILDASRLILWMSAGDRLYPVMGHGYSPETLARIGPIAREADNAAADAWRTGRLTVVGAPDGATDGGAILAPLVGLHACIGVLSVELRRGSERNRQVQALTTMIAAQLSTVVPAWPAASAPQGEAAPGDEVRSA